MKLNELRDKIHENARNKGFYNGTESVLQVTRSGGSEETYKEAKHAFFAQKIALIHSELSEVLEADRNNIKSCGKYGCFDESGVFDKVYFERWVKNSIEDELADVIIRVLDLCGWLNIDIEKHIELKMKYNELREHKHGKEY